ncbi:MAG: hypothetical protein D3909_06450 [Candidatus Electrothrix sp. ATG1]|nr:hypothetical protein [Candidatus Electrothrix sp. ATG1]MCI5209490.1 hypothetical protein [Candidatus Electrothrix sp. ATG2]
MSINCWEFQKCGRGVGGNKALLHGTCPAALDSSLNEIHGGRNGGRCCWLVRSYDDEYDFFVRRRAGISEVCENCNFYKMIEKTTDLIVTL